MTTDERPWGSIRPRGSGWEARVPTGSPRSKSFHDRNAAAAWLSGQRHLFDPRETTVDRRVAMTVGRLLAEYIKVAGTRRGWAELTFETYRSIVSSHLKDDGISSMPIDSVRTYHLTELVERVRVAGRQRGEPGPLGPRRTSSVVKFVADALRWAANQGYIERDPTGGVEYPRATRRGVALADDELADYLILTEGQWLHVPVACAVLAGLRRGEIGGRRRDDFDLDAGLIRVEAQGDGRRGLAVTKSPAGSRNVAIPSLLVEILREEFVRQDAHLGRTEPNPWLLVKRNGNPRSARSVGEAYRELIATLPVRRVRLHDLRHTYASHVNAELAEDEDRRALARQMGHASHVTTQKTYRHGLTAAQIRAADLLDVRIRSAIDRRRRELGR